jgi:hypothetical protein
MAPRIDHVGGFEKLVRGMLADAAGRPIDPLAKRPTTAPAPCPLAK